MNIRDLTDDQKATLFDNCQEVFTFRENQWRNIEPDRSSVYHTAFSDGVKATLKLLSDAQTRPNRS